MMRLCLFCIEAPALLSSLLPQQGLLWVRERGPNEGRGGRLRRKSFKKSKKNSALPGFFAPFYRSGGIR
jgi:hypothetical protein